MGSRPLELRVRTIEENAKKTRLSTAEEIGRKDGTVKKKHASAKIKDEETGDEIREYAATTMSELLGWYGYEKVDSGCTRALNLDHFASASDARNKLSGMDRNCLSHSRSSRSPLSVNTSSSSSFELSGLPLSYSTDNLKNLNRPLISPSLTLKSVPLHPASKFLHKSYSPPSCSENLVACSWCGRLSQTCDSGRANSLPYNMANALGQFCSEACFAAGRRAVFKRARTCDWCRHVRNPVSYVDLQDGESQLQFCSEKCLNQYKMNIFCHETQTHLTLHGLDNLSFRDSEKGGLITPELWFRNCQSPSHSSTDEVLIVDDQLISDSASSLIRENRRNSNDEFETKKSPQPDAKTTKRKNSFCIRKHVKSEACIEKNKFSTEADPVEIDRHEALPNQENPEFCRFTNDAIHCRMNYPESTTLNYSSPVSLTTMQNDKNNCAAADPTRSPCNSKPSVKSAGRGNNIHVKDIRELQKGQWPSDSHAADNQFKIPSSSKTYTNDLSQMKYPPQSEVFSRMTPFMTIPPLPPHQSQSSQHSAASSLLPPVTVLVPYPIPIPIPIPIPVSSAIFDKLTAEKQKPPEDSNDSNCKSFKCDSDCESLASNPSRLSIDTKVSTGDSLQDSPARCCYLSASSSNSNENNEEDIYLEHAKKVSVRPPRKRKRTNVENIENPSLQVKRRKKFVAV